MSTQTDRSQSFLQRDETSSSTVWPVVQQGQKDEPGRRQTEGTNGITARDFWKAVLHLGRQETRSSDVWGEIQSGKQANQSSHVGVRESSDTQDPCAHKDLNRLWPGASGECDPPRGRRRRQRPARRASSTSPTREAGAVRGTPRGHRAGGPGRRSWETWNRGLYTLGEARVSAHSSVADLERN